MIKKILKTAFKVLLFLVFVAFAISLIVFGVYYSNISRKQVIFGNMIDMIFEKTEHIFSIQPDYLIGDSFQVEGEVHFDLSSEEYQNKSVEDIEFAKKNRLLQNLNQMDTTYLIQHDRKKNRVYSEIDEKIGEEVIFHGQYYISDSTKYFFIQNVLNNYVNDGGNTYFESYTDDVTTVENIDYLYDFIRDSIKNHLNDDVLTGYDVETLKGNETVKAGQISYKVTDKSYKELLKSVLKDIKKDPRASQVASIFVPNIETLKVNEKKKYLKGNESYTINVYVTKPFFQPFKYEVIYLKDDQKEIYTYEGDMNQGHYYYSLNNVVKYKADYKSTSKNISIIVYDQHDTEIGTIKGDKDSHNLLLTMTLELDGKKYDISYTSKNKDKKKKQYTREDVLTFKIMDQMVTKIQGTIQANSTIKKDVKVEEDVTSSVLRSSLSEEEKQGIDHLYENIKTRLES